MDYKESLSKPYLYLTGGVSKELGLIRREWSQNIHEELQTALESADTPIILDTVDSDLWNT